MGVIIDRDRGREGEGKKEGRKVGGQKRWSLTKDISEKLD